MGLANYIKRVSRQTAVYWGTPTNDGRGSFTYADPVEIECRWENKDQVLMNLEKPETEYTSRAVVFINQDVDREGLLFLGKLTDLTAGEQSNPKTKSDIYIIKRVEKTPSLQSASDFLIKAFLTPWLT